MYMLVILLIFVFFAFIYLILPAQITGLLASNIYHKTYVDTVDIIVEEDMKYNWTLKDFPLQFYMRSFTVSGKIIGEGQAKVFLFDGQNKYLVLDSTQLDKSFGNLVGNLVLDIVETEPIEYNDAGDVDEQASDDINLVLDYNSGTQWDSDNDGIAELDEVVDLTVQNSAIKEGLDQSKLCTVWHIVNLDNITANAMCYGSNECCNFAGLDSKDDAWDALMFVMPIHGHNINVSTQVMYIEYSLDPENPYKKTIYSSVESLPVRFIPLLEDRTKFFKDIGEDTLLIEEFMDSKEYTLIFEVENGTILEIDEIRYTVEDLALSKNVYYEKLRDDETFDIVFNQIDYDNKTLSLEFATDGKGGIPVTIYGNMDYSLDNDIIWENREAQLVVRNWSNDYFLIVLGEKEEIMSFGKPEDIEFPVIIMDTDTEVWDAVIEFNDAISGDRKYRFKQKIDTQKNDLADIEEGLYNIIIEMSDAPVTEMSLENVNINKPNLSFDGFIGVDDIPVIIAPIEEMKRAYAINPNDLNFTFGSFTAAAEAKIIYKCIDWNYEERKCYGIWQKVLNTYPGYDYTIEIESGTPVFVEADGDLDYEITTPTVLGELEEVFESFNATVEDAHGDPVDVELEIKQKEKRIVGKIIRSKNEDEQTIPQGQYDVKIKPKEHVIKEIMIDDMNLTESHSIDNFITIDDPEDNQGYEELYAIDPSSIDFTNATVTVVASENANSLYKCTNWNFTEQECNVVCDIDKNGTEICQEDWIFLKDITPGEPYSFIINSTDPGFAENSEAADVAVAPIDDTTFVIAWIDRGQNDLSFRVMDTDGSVIVDTVDVDTYVDSDSRVSVSAIDSTKFVIAWVDGPSNDVTRAVYNINGNKLLGPSDVDTNVGYGDDTDVSVAQLGDRYVICYANDDDKDADFKIYWNTGSQISGEMSVDSDISPDWSLQNLIECAGVNSNRWVYFWFDNGWSDDATFSIRRETGSSVVSNYDIDNNVGNWGEVAVTTLDNNKFALAWFDSNSNDITFAIRWINNAWVAGPKDIDNYAGSYSRVAMATVREDAAATSDSFVIVWRDEASSNIKAGVYDGSGNTITSPFVVDSEEDSSFKLLDVTGRDPITGNSLCPGTFIVAFTNYSNKGEFKGFHVDGSPWDGTCGPVAPPNGPPTQTSPILNSTYGTNTTDENMTCYNQSTADPENDYVKNIYDWSINGSSIFLTLAPFEGGSNSTYTKDYSGALGYDLSVHGATWSMTSGYDGHGAYEFDGSNDYIDLDDNAGNSPVYDAQFNERTVLMWFNADSLWGAPKVLYSEGWLISGMEMFIYDGKIYGGAWSKLYPFTSWNGDWVSYTTTTGNWHFAAVVFNGDDRTISMYYDGNWQSIYDPAATQIATHFMSGDSIGRANGKKEAPGPGKIPHGSYFDGKIDDFMAFDRALTREQLDALYAGMTNTMVSQETVVDDTWQCSITPNDGYQDGITLSSNNLQIIQGTPLFNVFWPDGDVYNQTNIVNMGVCTNKDVNANANVSWDNATLFTNLIYNGTQWCYDYDFTNTTFPDVYNLIFNATDTNGNRIANTTNFTIKDVTPPSVTNITPRNGSRFYTGSEVFISANVTDYYYDNMGTVVANVSSNLHSDLINLTYNVTSGLWEGVFSRTDCTLVKCDLGWCCAGNSSRYNVIIIAIDNANNINDTEMTSFIVVNENFDSSGASGRKEEPEEIECEDNWECGDWGECIDGIQTRTCPYTGDCDEPKIVNPDEEQKCDLSENISITIIKSPRSINLIDSFTVSANVENTGDIPIENVVVNNNVGDGWSAEDVKIGTIDAGESKTVEINIGNNFCSGNYFLIPSSMAIELTARGDGVSDSDETSISVSVSELTVLTDSSRYTEGDVLRACIIYNNEGVSNNIGFDFNLNDNNDEPYILDILKSKIVGDGEILIITRDYVLDNIPSTGNYYVDVNGYIGAMGSDDYRVIDTGTSVFLTGSIEEKIEQKEKQTYNFESEGEDHIIEITNVDENFVDILLYSDPKVMRLKLLETVEVDTNEDGENDISLTYLGIKEGKTDIRMKTLPKKPKIITEPIQSFTVVKDEKTPVIEMPQPVEEESVWEKTKTTVMQFFFWLIIAGMLVFLVVLIVMLFMAIFSRDEVKK